MFIKVRDVLFFFFYHIILLTINITYVIIYLDTGMCFLIAKMHKMKEVQVDLKKLLQFLVGVKKETKKIKWPTKKQLITYSSATLVFMIVVGLFFTGLDFGFSYLKTLIG